MEELMRLTWCFEKLNFIIPEQCGFEKKKEHTIIYQRLTLNTEHFYQ